MQVHFNPTGKQFKTMKTMDRQALLAMMQNYEMYCVDLKEGAVFKSIRDLFSHVL
jgi:hypothetical protein